MVNDWHERRESWNAKWRVQLHEVLPEMARLFDALVHGVSIYFLLSQKQDVLIAFRTLLQDHLSMEQRLAAVAGVMSKGSSTLTKDETEAAEVGLGCCV